MCGRFNLTKPKNIKQRPRRLLSSFQLFATNYLRFAVVGQSMRGVAVVC